MLANCWKRWGGKILACEQASQMFFRKSMLDAPRLVAGASRRFRGFSESLFAA